MIINAASLSAADVQAAMDSSAPGDTVKLPAGTGHWTSSVIWTAPAGVTLAGAGTSDTGGADQTIIVDDVPGNDPGRPALVRFNVASTGTFRLTGITFQSSVLSSVINWSGDVNRIKDNGTIRFEGPGSIRIDHCHLEMSEKVNQKLIVIGSGVFGVIDSCIIDLWSTNTIFVLNGRGTQGNEEWANPTGLGGADFFFIEDNIINGKRTWSTYDARVVDSWTGGKVVVRFNTIKNSVLVETHATGHSGDDRGTRAQEVYGNLATTEGLADPNYVMADVRSGVSIVWGNSATATYKNMFLLGVPRADNTVFGNKAAPPNGFGYAGTSFNGTGSNWDGGTALGTDTLYGYPALDQPGRGQGDLLVGTFPSKTNNTTGTIYWPNQALEPIYIWDNTGNVVPGWSGSYYSGAGPRVAENRDYYPQASDIQVSPTSPFNGTSGTGWGTLANRPTTCTPGVAYFAIDQGDWNQSASNPYGVDVGGLSGILYKCTSTDTWTEYYEPYTYPHPLRGADLGDQYVESPEFSPVAGAYVGNQVITITTATSGATIKYTLDGSTPTSSSGLTYSSPIGITSDITIKAMAYKSGLLDSVVETAAYTITPNDPGPGISAGGLNANRINLV
jgi:hypothetical protein